jgi:hypothetical protein
MIDPNTTAAPADTTTAPTPVANSRPDHIPEKFWDADKGAVRVDDLLKSYGELEKAHSAPVDDTTTPDHDVARASAESAGLDWDTLVTKVASRAGLEDSDYAALEGVGVPKAIVDNYLVLVHNESTRQTELAHQHVGGEAKMSELLGWAADNLSAPEIATYNQMLGTRDGWKPALDVIAAKMAAASKTAGEPTLQGGVGGRPDTGGYSSRAAMMKDMGSPQYQTDPAFRAQVAQKLAVSRFESDR